MSTEPSRAGSDRPLPYEDRPMDEMGGEQDRGMGWPEEE
jgi:hypothetical protein